MTLRSRQTNTPSALLFVFVIAAILGLLSCWQLWEQDIFWQIRAGRELLLLHQLPSVDTWSFTATGGPWHNFQWLSTIIFDLVYEACGVPGLVVCRGILVFALMLFCGATLRRLIANELFFLWAAILLPLLFFASSLRIQIRSDFFVVVIFFALLWAGVSAFDWRKKIALYVFLIALSANLHPGTAVFIITTAIVFVAAEASSLRAFLLSVLLAVVAFFLTPYHFNVIGHLIEHVFYYQYAILNNPDHRPISLRHFDLRISGWAGCAWLILVCSGAVCITAMIRSRQSLGALRRPSVLLALFILFFALSLNRDRAMPFSAGLAVFFIAAAISKFQPPLTTEFSRRVLLIFATTVWLIMIPAQILYFPAHWGSSLSLKSFPVGSVNFIHAERPQGEIYHNPSYGDYLLEALPEYRVFMDTRESMYRSETQYEFKASSSSPESFAKLAEKYHINTALVPIGFLIGASPESPLQPLRRREGLFPQRDWALVAFDRISAVYVRRTDANRAIICRNEFAFLAPYFPPDTYLHSGKESPENNSRFLDEITRCEHWDIGNSLCASARAAWLVHSAEAGKIASGVAILERLYSEGPAGAQLLLDLHAAYVIQGRTAEAERIEQELAIHMRH